MADYIYDASRFRPLVRVIAEHAKDAPDGIAIRQKRYGIWQEMTWPMVETHMRQVAAGLIALGVAPGTKVGILSENRQEWVLAQFAAQCAGAVVVGMYPTSPSAEIAHLAQASDTEVLFIEDQEQFDKLLALDGTLPKLRQLIVFDPKGLDRADYLNLMSYDALCAKGVACETEHAVEIRKRIDRLQPDDTALMVFTSGSTGAPKAAEITHGNFHAGCGLIASLFEGLPSGSNILSYLPLCHVAEQNMTVLNTIAARRVMNFGESLRTVTPDLRDVAPEIFFGVPRIWEKMQAGFMVQLATTGRVQRWLTQKALTSAERRGTRPRADWTVNDHLSNAFWDALVYRHIRSFFGLGQCKVGITAAAPISPTLIAFFRNIGVNLREVWGMTETSGAATMQPDWGASAGRVGYFPASIEGKIADDGELLVQGDIVFKGYYGNPEATAKTFHDGWLMTGDIAEKLPDGSFSIIDRKKDIMINAAGKNLTPSLIENTMKASAFIKECIVIADGRPYVAALIQIDFDTVRLWAEEKGIVYTHFRSLAEHPDVEAL
ncbi:MAG: long-chain fatty acid--CoA ligase, partial [Pseudomonadota bacterium]